MNQNFSIIIPIFNEKKNIKKLINKIIKSLSKIKLKYEVIFIDDNSYDGSKEILKNIKKRNIHFYIRNKTRDLSQSCILGFDKSKYNNIIVMDGDLQHDPRYLPIIIKIFFKKNYDFVICSRDFFKLILKKKSFLLNSALFYL